MTKCGYARDIYGPRNASCHEKCAEGSMYCAQHNAEALARVYALGISATSMKPVGHGGDVSTPQPGTKEG